MRLRTIGMLTAAIVGLPVITYLYGSEQNPSKPPTVSDKVITTSWSGQNGDMAASFVRVHCATYTVTFTNRGKSEQPWKLIINRKVFGSGSIPSGGAAKQVVPIKNGNDIQLTIEYGSVMPTALYNQPVPGARNC